MRKRLKVPIFQWDCREVSGETVLPIPQCCQGPRPPSSGLDSESVRSPISLIVVDRPARADPAVTVDERRCGLTPTRLDASRRAGPTAGPRSLSHPCNATDLGRGRRTAVDEGSVRTAPADETVSTRPWTRSSACGTPLPPTRAGRTISSKRLRGTDSIPVFPQRVRRGTRDGPGSPTPLPRTPGAQAFWFCVTSVRQRGTSVLGRKDGRVCPWAAPGTDGSAWSLPPGTSCRAHDVRICTC